MAVSALFDVNIMTAGNEVGGLVTGTSVFGPPEFTGGPKLEVISTCHWHGWASGCDVWSENDKHEQE